MLVRNLAKALRLRRIEEASTEPYWLRPGQYCEEDGRIKLRQYEVLDMYVYAARQRMRPLGLVVVKAGGEHSGFLNENPISPAYREFARELFRAHMHFWFEYLPSLDGQLHE